MCVVSMTAARNILSGNVLEFGRGYKKDAGSMMVRLVKF